VTPPRPHHPTSRFLQRQQCQEGEAQEEAAATSVTKSEPPPSPPPPTTSALVKQHSSPVLPYSSPVRVSPPPCPPPKEEPPDPQPLGPGDRQPSLDPLCGLESVPLLYSR